jgi:hypothetical protein
MDAITNDKDDHPKLSFNFIFGEYLRRLERRAGQRQYELAVLSTLGGAYHLCNRPKTALLLACKQEQLGRKIGSSVIVVRALVHQAINFRALGYLNKSRDCMQTCKNILMAMKEQNHASYKEMEDFVKTNEAWMLRNFIDPSSDIDLNVIVG